MTNTHPLALAIMDNAQLTADRITAEIARIDGAMAHVQTRTTALITAIREHSQMLMNFVQDDDLGTIQVLSTHKRELEKLRADVLKGEIHPPEEPTLDDNTATAIAERFGAHSRFGEIPLEESGSSDDQSTNGARNE